MLPTVFISWNYITTVIANSVTVKWFSYAIFCMEDALFMEIRDMVNMTIGMAIGMAASPLMMKGIRIWRTKMKVNRILREIAESRKE